MGRNAIVFLFIICCLFKPCSAIEPIYVDTTHCTVKNFDQKHFASYRSDRHFDYETEPAKEGGLLSAIWYFIADFFDKLGEAHVGRITMYDVLFYGLAVFAAAMIVFHFFKAEITGLFSNGNAQIITHQSFSENVHELDFDDLIQKALNGGDYRLATRLYYLSTLKKLSEAGLINWQKNKTNFEYYYELKGDEQRKQFFDLTRIFESAWYGNLEITATAYDENLKAFSGFLQTIKR